MNTQTLENLEALGADDIARVHGGNIGPVVIKVPRAEDMYGNTLSVEEWMDRQVAVATTGTLDPFDFYSPGYNPDKPNIWR